MESFLSRIRAFEGKVLKAIDKILELVKRTKMKLCRGANNPLVKVFNYRIKLKHMLIYTSEPTVIINSF